MLDERAIRQWWDILKGTYPVEFRIFRNGTTYSGYFDNVDDALVDLRLFDGGAIYATLNPCQEACMSRDQGGKIIKIGKNPTTSGNDIARRDYILVDIDPERVAGTNATDDEKRHAERMMREVVKFLRNMGMQLPVVADSANGYHLYYRVALENSQEVTALVSRFLHVLDMYFSDEYAKVDTAVSDPNRIAKVMGTQSAKGRNTVQRPQRMSGIIYVPDEFKVTERVFVEKVADQMPMAPRPTRENNYTVEKFDVDEFIRNHSLDVVKRSAFKDGEKIVLRECPFDPNHQASAIFKLSSGAIGFKCFHNSCSSYTWKDVRLKYEPDAYEKRDRILYENRHRFDAPVPSPPKAQNDELGHKWLSPTEIRYIDPNSFPFIPTGINQLDRVMLGLTLGDVSVVSGLAGTGKTTFLDFIILNAREKGFRSVAWSGELQDFRFMSWLNQMAAGKTNVLRQVGYDNIYYAPQRICRKIDQWLDGYFWLYNNKYGNRWSQLLNDIREAIREHGPQLIIVDNLTALDLDTAGGDKNDRQKSFINELKDLSKRESVHIMLVCHPRKEQSFHMLRMESIAGSSDLINLCDNIFIIHRSGQDLKKRMLEFFSEQVAEEYSRYDAVIEIAKNRSHGKAGTLLGLFFEVETRRYQNEIDENIVYGWDSSAPRMYIDPSSIMGMSTGVEEFEKEYDESEDLPE